MNRYLLFDSGCSLCTEIARRVEEASNGWLEARSLRDPEMQSLLDRAKPDWRWEPTLVEVNGDNVHVYQGLKMRLHFLRILGIRRTLLLMKAMYGYDRRWKGVDYQRREFVRNIAVMLGVSAFLPQNKFLSSLTYTGDIDRNRDRIGGKQNGGMQLNSLYYCSCPGGGSWCCDVSYSLVSCVEAWPCNCGYGCFKGTWYASCNPVFGCNSCYGMCTGPYDWCSLFCQDPPAFPCTHCQPAAPC